MDARVNKVGHEAVVIYNAQRIGRVALVVGRRGNDLILLDGGKRVTRWAGSCGTAYPTDNGQAGNR